MLQGQQVQHIEVVADIVCFGHKGNIALGFAHIVLDFVVCIGFEEEHIALGLAQLVAQEQLVAQARLVAQEQLVAQARLVAQAQLEAVYNCCFRSYYSLFLIKYLKPYSNNLKKSVL